MSQVRVARGPCVDDGSWGGPENWCWSVLTARGGALSHDDQTLLCASCGYWENYLRNPEVIADIVANGGGENRVKVTPARWMTDPTNRHELRHWDGTMWTSSVSDAGAVCDDPIRPRLGPFMVGD